MKEFLVYCAICGEEIACGVNDTSNVLNEFKTVCPGCGYEEGGNYRCREVEVEG